ncbi:differentially expressed in FDCP 8-like protein [Elysia marginata]|uniref:Differentially expressed in FDCP 8-like protein n=1 Tax=Elysia marginata TaxID=1093978 RepID=A0AAV4FCP6_9GAST|nr:differentially expressed in FDCP 8-like protein [Elysia marginata]
MEKTEPLKLVETDTASVKMTVGKPFTPGLESSSSSDEELDEVEKSDQLDQTSLDVKHQGKPSRRDHKLDNGIPSFSPSNAQFNSDRHKNEVFGNDIKKDLVKSGEEKDFKYSFGQAESPKDLGDVESMRNADNAISEGNHGNGGSTGISEGMSSSQPATMKNDHKISTSKRRPLQTQSTNAPARTGRVNPFNRDLLVEEDHFSDTENFFLRHGQSTGSYTSSSSHSQGFDWQNQPEDSSVTFAELGLSEDHFSHPQGHFGLSGAEELELAIENCKELIRDATPDSEKQKNLVLKLVQLRIKLQEIKEGAEPLPENMKVILSHKMLLHTSKTSKYYCERCNGGIWGMLQVWYKCTECGYRCHERCLHQILRTCPKAKVLENPTLCLDICPVDPIGLAAQGYRCAECRAAISFQGRTSLDDEPKSDRTKISTNEEKTTRVDELIKCDRRMKIRKFALKLEIPKSMVHEIVHDTLGYQKVSARWAPKMLTEDHKLQRIEISQSLLLRCQQDNGDEDMTYIGVGPAEDF